MLGPQQWDLIVHKIIGKISETGNEPIAYADDLAIVIVENARKEIEQKANTITKIIECQKQKLKLSAKKLQMILLKGFLDSRRPLTIWMDNVTLKIVAVTRYLEIHFDVRKQENF